MTDKQYYDLKRDIRKIESMVMDIYDSTIKSKKRCPICKNEIRLYLPFGIKMRYNAQCPVCRSLERHRALWLFFEEHKELFEKENIKVLHFAPESVFLNYFSLKDNIDYWPVDINPKMPGIRETMDITNIPFEDNSIDMIICNHVLEHVPDEKKALSELYRILAKDGVAFLNVPIDNSKETTLENPEYNTPELRVKYYGQSDHVRMYGRDYIEHLKKASFRVEVIEPNKHYSKQELENLGLVEREYIYLCRK